MEKKEKTAQISKKKYLELEQKCQALEGELKILKEKLATQEKEASHYLDLLKRMKADFDNYRKRVIKEQTLLVERASKDLIEKLLPVIDNLERAIKSSRENPDFPGLLSGVEMIYQQLIEILEREGLEPINPQSEPFDPECHEAVISEVKEGYQNETILEVLQKGYRLKGSLLRPAKVKVCQNFEQVAKEKVDFKEEIEEDK